jgi:peptidoglycan/LPS O-acetylase OafA/YrhL
LNHDTHAGWQMLPMALFGASWLIAQMYLTVNTEEARAGKIIPPPSWLNSLQAIFLFSLFLGKGVVVLADRLTQHWPDFFPLAYLVLLAAFLVPVWIWHPEKDKKLTWRKTSILILYAIAASFLLALSYKKDDPITSSYLWVIPLVILAFFLLIVWFAKRELRAQVITASWVIVAFLVWIAATFWLANWIS